jgi:hypothetical protein
VPAALATVTWTCTGAGGGTCTASGSGNTISTTANLPAGGSVHYVVTGTLSPTATGQLINTATILPPAGVIDPDISDNSATDVNDITPTADLSIAKDNGQTTVTPGTAVTWQIVASNDGPSAVTGAATRTPFPPRS